MYDFHTHTIFSDGELLPTELLRRMSVLGYKVVGITDHVDKSNLTNTINSIEKIRSSAEEYEIKLLTGVELTHVPPREIKILAKAAKEEGADIVIVHGETTSEPVAPLTNNQACSCEYVDILAHPGLITEEDATLAREMDIYLELTARAGHNRTNGHVAKIAEKIGCNIVIDSDTHSPDDIMSEHLRHVVAKGSGLSQEMQAKAIQLNIGHLKL